MRQHNLIQFVLLSRAFSEREAKARRFRIKSCSCVMVHFG